jgi:hypothetical protein
MRNLALVASIAAALLLAGCVTALAPTMGTIVTQTKGPVSGVDNNVGQTKVGESECTGIIFVAIGDASIKKAMDQGGITKIHHIDCESLSVLGLYAKYKTIVYGE